MGLDGGDDVGVVGEKTVETAVELAFEAGDAFLFVEATGIDTFGLDDVAVAQDDFGLDDARVDGVLMTR